MAYSVKQSPNIMDTKFSKFENYHERSADFWVWQVFIISLSCFNDFIKKNVMAAPILRNNILRKLNNLHRFRD